MDGSFPTEEFRVNGDNMPEYLAPSVYVEEVGFRSKSIEGVPTKKCITDATK